MILQGGEAVILNRAVRYLEMMCYDRFNFKDHFYFVFKKASVTQGAIERIMPYIDGPNTLKRRIMMRVITTVML